MLRGFQVVNFNKFLHQKTTLRCISIIISIHNVYHIHQHNHILGMKIPRVHYRRMLRGFQVVNLYLFLH